MNSLPIELLAHIFQYIPLDVSKARLQRVCHKWRASLLQPASNAICKKHPELGWRVYDQPSSELCKVLPVYYGGRGPPLAQRGWQNIQVVDIDWSSNKQDLAFLQGQEFPCLTKLVLSDAVNLRYENFPILQKLSVSHLHEDIEVDDVCLPQNLQVTVKCFLTGAPGMQDLSKIPDKFRQKIHKLFVKDYSCYDDEDEEEDVYPELRLAPFATFPRLKKLVVHMIEPGEECTLVVKDLEQINSRLQRIEVTGDGLFHVAVVGAEGWHSYVSYKDGKTVIERQQG